MKSAGATSKRSADGRFRHWIDGAAVAGSYSFDVHEPATGRVYASASEGTAADVNSAVAAAKHAAVTWSRLGVSERSEKIFDVLRKIEPHIPDLASVESRDTGKPISLVLNGEGPGAMAEIGHYAHAAVSRRDALHSGSQNSFGLTLRQPYGVVGLIIPYNSPLMVLAEKLGQALATGNCVVIKPSPLAPASAEMFARLLTECGLPPGVVNVVQGTGESVGRALCEHPDVPRLSFTGSTRIGQEILRQSAAGMKRVTLELSGKNACLIFPDADLDSAVANAVLSGFLLTGQLCTSGSRILVHEDVADAFIRRFVRAVADLRIGLPDDPATQVGPLISAAHRESVRRHVTAGRADCELLYEGSIPATLEGWFEPLRIFRVHDTAHFLMQEEVFGPISCIATFTSEDEALAIANATRYGLSSFLWTNDFRRIDRFVRELESGRVWVNTGHTIPADMTLPPWKLSGLGEEGGLEGMLSFTRAKTINMRATGSVPAFWGRG